MNLKAVGEAFSANRMDCPSRYFGGLVIAIEITLQRKTYSAMS
jgi:hypothetical protein